ncbi:MAG: OadG family protein [Spirochaetes bacterium]|uniref:OadG family protein n=1 Tax=Candidatus Ornithospirochaeta stercoripullorum TaxID=2840899 RepID=A0A9D9E045_9SPIO|nr:OadG family protein [Candidatus Ornithospirochaeta stercoripullorum]
MLTMLTNMPKDVLVQQIKDGLVLLVLGMGTVFIFLVILIFASKMMSKIIMNMEKNRHGEATEQIQAVSTVQVQQKVSAPQGDDAAVAAAIAAAYDRSRN